MRCEQANELFHPYLDGELAPSLAGELAAHCLSCPDCRQALALIEVTGHLISTDDEPIALDEGFTDRLMACLPDQRSTGILRFRRYLRVGAPLAAAAVIVLALLGAFEHKTRVAGQKEFASSKASSIVETAAPSTDPAAAPAESGDPSTVPQPVRWENLPRAIERLLTPSDPDSDDANSDESSPARSPASSVEDL